MMDRIHSIEQSRKFMSGQRISPARHIKYKLLVGCDGYHRWIPSIEAEGNNELELAIVPDDIYVFVSDAKKSEEGVSGKGKNLYAQWDVGAWLGGILKKWSTYEITIRFVSFDYGSVRVNLFSQLDKFKEIEHNWRILLVSDGKEFANTSVMNDLLNSPIDRLEIYPYDRVSGEINFRVLEALKNLIDLRDKRRQNLPSIVCKVRSKSVGDIEKIRVIEQKAKQAGIDEFVVMDDAYMSETEEPEIWDL